MNLTLSRILILIATVIFTASVAAKYVVLNSPGPEESNNNLMLNGHYDSAGDVQIFNWNNEKIKHIPLLKAQLIKPQYSAALDVYFKQIAQLHGANKKSLSQPYKRQIHDTGRGGIIGKYSQNLNDIEVFGRSINVLINRKNEYVASSGSFTAIKNTPKSAYVLSETQALAIGFKESTGEDIYLSLLIDATNNSKFRKIGQGSFSANYVMGESSRVKKVFFPLNDNSLTPAYYLEVETSQIDIKQSRLMSYVIDGLSGNILFKNNLTSHVATTYKVFADDSGKNFPFDGPQGTDLSPHPTGDVVDTPAVGTTFVTPNSVTLDFGPISTFDPWLSATDTTTQGNNVDAYADISGENGFDAEDVRAEMTSANAFEYDFASFSAGLTGNAQKYAVVNLFYTNNFLHDWFYDNGFDEVAGNAQLSNYNRGGLAGDRLLVEAQDFADNNNANMSTPSDGSSPRMQMFIWTFLSNSLVEISAIPDINSTTAVFGPDDYDVTAVLSLVDDGITPVGDGCEAINTDLTDRIAIIDRGDCNFTVKVKNAQDQGAVGVLMVNNVADPSVITMGGEDLTINIPSQMVSLARGTEIKNSLQANNTLQARLVNSPNPVDGTLDNGIVAHEWAHYLSNRLIGNANGLTNNQGRSMGEGWSDFVALLMIVKESDNLLPGNNNFQAVYSPSTFVGNAYYGIRRAPYTTDMSKNALTFKHIEDGVELPTIHPVAFGSSGVNNSEVHASGEIWAVALWEVFVGLLNKPGYSFEQAREIMKDYLVAGMKMTPNAPTMLEARDALLSAVLATNNDDFAIVRDAFSRRGMGASAIAPLRHSEDHRGVVEDSSAGVDVQAFIYLDRPSIDIANCDIDGVLDVSETATIDMTFKNVSGQALPPFNVNLSSLADLSFSNSVIAVETLPSFGSMVSKSFEITLNSATKEQEIEIFATVDEIGLAMDDFVEPASISTSLITNFDFNKTLFNDDMSSVESSGFDWTVQSDPLASPFIIENAAWHGFAAAAAGASDLITPIIKVAATGAFSLSFEHFYFFESSEEDSIVTNWDGGVIEVSVDGSEWVDVIAFGGTLSDPYNGVLDDFNSILGGRQAYTATRDVNDLSLFSNVLTFADGLVNGQNIRIRFRIGTDANSGDFGWLIDNLVVTNAIAPMFSEIVVEDNICLSGNPPLVSAGQDLTLRATDSTNLTIALIGSATDPDGDPLTVQWLQRAGPEVVLNNANTTTADFTLAATTADINLVFELSVSDNSFTISDLVNVQVKLNNAPTVSATGSTVTEGQIASLSSTASDLDGDNLSFIWQQTAGTTVTLNNPNSANPTFTAPQVDGTVMLTFQVIVNDGFEDSVAATATVTVNNQVLPGSGGGGGGSIPFSMLIILVALASLKRPYRFKE